MRDEVTIRSMESDDLPKLAQIYVDIDKIRRWPEGWTVDKAQKLLSSISKPDMNSPIVETYVAEHGGELIGAIFAYIKHHWDRDILLGETLIIDPKYPKRDIEGALYDKVFRNPILNFSGLKPRGFSITSETG